MDTVVRECVARLIGAAAWSLAALASEEAIGQKAAALIARQEIVQLAQLCEQALRPGAEQERAELCRAIIAHVRREEVSPVVKGELLTLLGRFGKAESVEFLASLVSHADPLFHTRAVLGLQMNPTEEAAAALRKALAAASEPDRRAALLHALALRADRASLPQFLKDAASPNDAVRTAALAGVARVADQPAGDLFSAAMKQGPETARRAATDAYIQHADRLARVGKKQEALAIYRELLGQGAHAKAAALLGLARVGGADEVKTILENLRGAELSVLAAASDIFDHIPRSGAVVAAVCEAARTAEPACKARLIGVLARYGDPAGLPTVLEAAGDADLAVRAAAVSALGRFDDKRAAEALVGAVASGKEAAAALGAIETSPMKPALADGLIAALPGTSGQRRVAVVQALRACPPEKAVPALLKVVDDADPAVRSEVFLALRRVGDTSVYPRLVERLAEEPNEQVQSVAVIALAALGARIKDPSERTAPVVARLAAGGGAGRPALLLLLSRVATQATQGAGLKFVREALGAQDEKLRRAAIEAMAAWPDPDTVMDDLHMASEEEPESALGLLALRAYCKQVGALVEKRDAVAKEKRLSTDEAYKEIVRRCAEGMKLALKPAERVGFLSHLGRMPHPDALKLVMGYLGDPDVKKEAIQAAWAIASALHKTHPEVAKPALEKIKAATGDKQLQSRVEQLLRAMETQK